MLGALAQAGMPLYGAQTPDGDKNVASAWLNPEALAQRVQWASRIGAGSGRSGDSSAQVLANTLGAILKDSKRKTVAAAPAELRSSSCSWPAPNYSAAASAAARCQAQASAGAAAADRALA